MKFSTKTLYGLKAVLVLGNRFGEGSLSVSQIAKKEGISLPYLEQILNALKKKGLVKSVRGPQGGYVLAKKPAQITLEDLFYTLENKSFLEPNGTADPREDEISIANLIFWRRVKHSLEAGLKETTLKDLLDEARRIKKGKSKNSPTFHI